MSKFRYLLLLVLPLLLLGLDFGSIPQHRSIIFNTCDTLSFFFQRRIDSIAIQHSMKLPFGSTPSLQVYNDSLLISSFNMESYTDYDREANEFFGIDEKFFHTDIFLTDKNRDSKRLFSKKLNSSGYETHPAVSADGKLLIFSRKKNLKSMPELYYSLFENDTWRVKKKLIFNDYKKTVIASFPHLNADNDLYFVSGKNLESGELDIFIAKKNTTNWAAPDNLGNSLNTSYNEISPVQVGDSLLFFASDRPGGFGGYDLYVGRLSDSGYIVSNLGEPFNTPLDELYFLAQEMDLSKGYIVRYTETDKVTPDLFSFTMIFAQDAQYLSVGVTERNLEPSGENSSLNDEALAEDFAANNEQNLTVREDSLQQTKYAVVEKKTSVEDETGTNLFTQSIFEGKHKPIAESRSYQKVKISIELLDTPGDNNQTNDNIKPLLARDFIDIPYGSIARISLSLTD